MDYIGRIEAAYRRAVCSPSVQDRKTDEGACQELADVLSAALPRTSEERNLQAILRGLVSDLTEERRRKIEIAREALRITAEGSSEGRGRMQKLCASIVDPNHGPWTMFPDRRKYLVLLLDVRDMERALGVSERLHISIDREDNRFRVSRSQKHAEGEASRREGRSTRGRRRGSSARGSRQYQATGVTHRLEEDSPATESDHGEESPRHRAPTPEIRADSGRRAAEAASANAAVERLAMQIMTEEEE